MENENESDGRETERKDEENLVLQMPMEDRDNLFTLRPNQEEAIPKNEDVANVDLSVSDMDAQGERSLMGQLHDINDSATKILNIKFEPQRQNLNLIPAKEKNKLFNENELELQWQGDEIDFDSSPELLIIDDEPMNRMALDAQLATVGIIADQMSSGIKAVAHIRQLIEQERALYKIILCDFSMPELDGPQTAYQIRAMCQSAGLKCPWIACVTAYQEASFHKMAMAAGMSCFYTKPLMYNQILEIKA